MNHSYKTLDIDKHKLTSLPTSNSECNIPTKSTTELGLDVECSTIKKKVEVISHLYYLSYTLELAG